VIGLDTNVVVRYLAQDDPIQSGRATRLLEHVLTAENPGFVSVVVMAEIAWVLERAYRLKHREIAAAIETMLQSEVLTIEREQEVFSAMIVLKEGQGSFTDALIGALAAAAGCSQTLTFDRKAVRLAGFAPA
jgi:predicted nucleic-acid-binding protein